VALEPEFWEALTRIAARRDSTLSALVSTADGERVPLQPLASALRVLALRAFDPDVEAHIVEPETDNEDATDGLS
jgi:predicted DNA-binding ribbon-helix-helix protein